MANAASITLSKDYLQAYATTAGLRRDTLEMTRHAFDIVAAPHSSSYSSTTENGAPLAGQEIIRHNLQAPMSYIDVNATKTETGNNLLHELNLHADSTELVNDLIAHGIRVNVHNEDGDTPLHLAMHGMLSTTPFDLIEAGASLVRPNHTGHTPIDIAHEFHQYNMLIELIDLYDQVVRIENWVAQCHTLLEHYKTSQQWHLMTPQDALKLANIDAHQHAFCTSHWVGHEAQAIALNTALPPYLQEELSAQLALLTQAMPEAAPVSLIQGWSASVCRAQHQSGIREAG